jgi:hypothetical protein
MDSVKRLVDGVIGELRHHFVPVVTVESIVAAMHQCMQFGTRHAEGGACTHPTIGALLPILLFA